MAGLRAPPFAAIARGLLLLFLVALPLMKPKLIVFGLAAAPIDLLAPPLFAFWLAALAARQIALERDWLLATLIPYLAALVLSTLSSQDPARSALKLLTQLYLLGLPLVAASIVAEERQLRAALRCWLTGTAIALAVGIAGLAAYAIDPGSALYRLAAFPWGSLPPGSYPRLAATFVNANLLCNYLAVSLLILFGAARAGWVGRGVWLPLAGSLLLCAAFTISPGLGGILLALGGWLWLLLRSPRPRLARLFLGGGIAAALLFVGAAAVTPILHPTAPFLISIPWGGLTLAPAGRLMTWMGAAATFLAHPLLGIGIGIDPVRVTYLAPSGELQHLTDAHNLYLSIAAQAGALGLAAILFLIVRVWRRAAASADALAVALGFAFLDGLAYQGLTGSFEDARHLWLLLGFFAASLRLQPEGVTRAGPRAAGRARS